jgi:hypothetical protein
MKKAKSGKTYYKNRFFGILILFFALTLNLFISKISYALNEWGISSEYSIVTTTVKGCISWDWGIKGTSITYSGALPKCAFNTVYPLPCTPDGLTAVGGYTTIQTIYGNCGWTGPYMSQTIIKDVTYYSKEVCGDRDNDGYYAISANCPQGNDCNDNDPNIYPGSPEVCDEKDNNCDGQIENEPLPIVKTEKWVVFGGLACKHIHHHGYYYCRRSKLHAASCTQETREFSPCCKAQNIS